MKQSLSCYLPKLNNVISFKNFIDQTFDGHLFIAHCEETDKRSFKQELKPHTDITILIGPEGDFSNSELDLALHHGFESVNLGRSRLRTETAGVVVANTVALVNNQSIS